MSERLTSEFLRDVSRVIADNRPRIEVVNLNENGHLETRYVRDTSPLHIIPLNAVGEEGFAFNVIQKKLSYPITVTLGSGPPATLKAVIPAALFKGKVFKFGVEAGFDRVMVQADQGIFEAVQDRGDILVNWHNPFDDEVRTRLTLVHIVGSAMNTERSRLDHNNPLFEPGLKERIGKALVSQFGTPGFIREPVAEGSAVMAAGADS